ncbi:hypothetical protein Trydic_g8566 [Trypoxylus dichotomus]
MPLLSCIPLQNWGVLVNPIYVTPRSSAFAIYTISNGLEAESPGSVISNSMAQWATFTLTFADNDLTSVDSVTGWTHYSLDPALDCSAMIILTDYVSTSFFPIERKIKTRAAPTELGRVTQERSIFDENYRPLDPPFM